MNQNRDGGSQSILRAFQVLDAFSNGDRELGVRELSRRLGLPRSTVHRLVVSLQVVGALEQNPETDKYRLGLKLFELGTLVATHWGFQERVQKYLEDLVARSGETAHLAILDSDGYAVLVNKIASPRAVTVGGAIGTRRPVYCSAIGKALIAFLPEPKLERLLSSITLVPRTPRTITDPDRFRQELALVRERGYSVDNEEFEEGLRCVAAPIFNTQGRASAAIGISGPSQRLNAETLPGLARITKDEADTISRDLGHFLFVSGTFE